MRLAALTFIISALVLCQAVQGRQFWEYLDPGKRYCYAYDAPAGPHTVTLHYEAFDGWNGHMEMWAEHSGRQYGEKGFALADTQTHAFTTSEPGLYKACLQFSGGEHAKMYVWISSSIEMDFTPDEDIKHANYDENFRHLKHEVTVVSENHEYFSQRAVTFEHTISNTFGRVLFFTVLNGAVLIGAGIWQVLHLKSFFKEKKVV